MDMALGYSAPAIMSALILFHLSMKTIQFFKKKLFAVIGKKNLLEYRLKQQEHWAKQTKQKLQAKNHELEQAKQTLQAKYRELEQLKNELLSMHLSGSWRMTRPLRKVIFFK
jgi:hypothetical protein